jgi:DNA sulfur modification protein DndB
MTAKSILGNLHGRLELAGLARKKARPYDQMSVKLKDLDEHLSNGWKVSQKRKTSATLQRPKKLDALLEDRVWALFWRMGFPQLSGLGGAQLVIEADSDHPIKNQIDVVAMDDEVCIVVECKSQQSRGRRPDLQQELAKLAVARGPVSIAVIASAGSTKKTSILVYWTQNAVISRTDRERAQQHNIVIADDDDLSYYETLVNHLGPAARYQFLAEFIPGKAIPGLSITVPALQSKMAGHISYTFAIAPEFLLKVAYVSHRARGRGSDIATYQRMVSRNRLKKIADYIRSDPDAMFPTNIVINLEKAEKGKKGAGAQFEKSKQQEGSQGAVFGWLTLHPSYKSAWIIDGQHRLYAYSYAGEPFVSKSSLSVLAFEGLPASVQQKLFVDINGEQKSVKRGLLQELYADLHRGSDNPKVRIQALISEAVQELDGDPSSPFFDRILLADHPRSEVRCISLTSVFSSLDKQGLYFQSVNGNMIIGPGPLWAKDDDEIVKRTKTLLNHWFGRIRSHVPDWWSAGAAEGGGLSMNDGVSVCIAVLRSVVDHFDGGKVKLYNLDSHELNQRIDPFADAFATYLAGLSADQRIEFRSGRGNQGQTAPIRHAQKALQDAFPEFRPDGLADYIEREQAKTNDQASSLIKGIERLLQKVVVGVLKDQYSADRDEWWYEGVPATVRKPASLRQDEDKNQRGARERYLDLIDYRTIITTPGNWTLFVDLLAQGKGNESRDKRSAWIARVNEIRHVAEHASSATWVSFEQVAELRDTLEWLEARIASGPDAEQVSGES